MKKSLITLTVMLAAVALVVVFCGSAMAKVTGRCDDCHTMHFSQGGEDWNASGGPHGKLLVKNCVGCHTGTNDGSNTTPYVYSSSAPAYLTNTLAGGNFYWMKHVDHTKGHNVLDLWTTDGDGEDDNITKTLGAPGNSYSCANSCHMSLAWELPVGEHDSSLRNGCQGCHLKVRHHANDGTGTKYVDSADKGWYRFLAKHNGGAVENHGVVGIEDENWQYTNSSTDHNEYMGVPTDKTTTTSLTNRNMTAYCCGCHGDFHKENSLAATGAGSQSPWLRHPSDFVIPSDTALEYSGMSTAYDPLSPVARPVGFTWGGGPIGTVATGTDMVMCLSCHVPHGSPYDDLLRWNYADMLAGGGGTLENQGCFYCHVTKDD